MARVASTVRPRILPELHLRKHRSCQNWSMHAPEEQFEEELMEISAIADDTLRFARIIAWCTSKPDDVPFALHQLISRRYKHASPTSVGLPESRRQ